MHVFKMLNFKTQAARSMCALLLPTRAGNATHHISKLPSWLEFPALNIKPSTGSPVVKFLQLIFYKPLTFVYTMHFNDQPFFKMICKQLLVGLLLAEWGESPRWEFPPAPPHCAFDRHPKRSPRAHWPTGAPLESATQGVAMSPL